MSLADDLLDQALHLCQVDPRKPRQANLRRALSTAYYALFHLLVDAAASRFTPTNELKPLFGRAFNHGDIKKVCKWMAGTPPDHWKSLFVGIPRELKQVAEAFVDLQEARHQADYDLGAHFTRLDVAERILTLRSAFDNWERIKASPAVTVFLSALLIEPLVGRRS